MSCTILQDGNSSAPILLWLQGGPGGSSLFGLFNEGGPLLVDKDGNLKDKPWTWNSKYHMIFIDNPVSTSTEPPIIRHSLRRHQMLHSSMSGHFRPNICTGELTHVQVCRHNPLSSIGHPMSIEDKSDCPMDCNLSYHFNTQDSPRDSHVSLHFCPKRLF